VTAYEGAGQWPVRPDSTRLRLESRSVALIVSGFVTVFLLALTVSLPAPYVALRPGPVVNTLGRENGQPLIVVTGHQSYPAKGQLDLTTVSLLGTPDEPLTIRQAIAGWLDGTVAVVPEAEIFPPGQTQQDTDKENQREMVDSQQAAAAAALTQLGFDVKTTLKVTGLTKESAAKDVIKDGDEILALNGTATPQLDTLRAALNATKPGDTVTVRIRRAGKESTVSTRTIRGDDGTSALGVFIGRSYVLPFQVRIQLDDIGGPSAGMMFALGIVDLLTPGDLTGGKQIAGTGTMDDESGKVGEIGGIRQKLVGARRAGAAWFLAPAGNCNEVVGHVPDGLRVVKVATLAQAEDAVKAIAAGTTQSLPGC
jgi:PDZ domain-containing protein